MRIVSRKELMALPPGTVYSYYQPHVFHGLNVKGESWEHDFLMASLVDDFAGDSTTFEEECARFERGEDVPLEFGECFTREGLFDDTKKYAVWSTEDMRGLARYLNVHADLLDQLP